MYVTIVLIYPFILLFFLYMIDLTNSVMGLFFIFCLLQRRGCCVDTRPHSIAFIISFQHHCAILYM